MTEFDLQMFIAKRIRHLRLKKGMTQEELEEKADLGTNYAYKLEHLNTNIKVNTLQKVIKALDTDLATFFDFNVSDENPDIIELITNLKRLTKERQEAVIQAMSLLMKQMK